jgi:hypothetical protein
MTIPRQDITTLDRTMTPDHTMPAAPQTPKPPAPPGGAVYEQLNGMHGYRMPNGGWVPGDHPIATQAGAQTMNPNAGGVGPPPGTAPPGAPGAPGQPTTQQNVLQGQATAGGQVAQGTPTTVAGAFQQALINRMAPPDVTSSNPAISGSITANRNAETRGLGNTQRMLAERAASTGQTGAQEVGLRQAIGESAGRQGAYEGNALYGLHQQQEQNLSQALGLGGSMLSDQAHIEAQQALAQLQAQLQREGLAQQGQLGNRELDIRDSLGQGNLGLGYAGLLQGGEQFRQGLGANMGIEQARLNMQAMLGMFGGL